MENMKPLFIKPVDAAKLLGTGKSKLYAMLAAGQIPSVKIAGMTRIPLAALENLAAEAMCQTEVAGSR
jgi:excisionase family DNA binding protein